MKVSVPVLSLLLFLMNPAQVTDLMLGGTHIQVGIIEKSGRGLHYLNLHDDENTAVQAALSVIETHGGRIVDLRHTGERNITFKIGDAPYTVDPNRIFTDAGATLTLRKNGAYSDAALRAVRTFAEELLDVYGFDEQQTIVTLHNNTEGDYSAKSYLPGSEYGRDAQSVHIEPGKDPDDFFFVTTPEVYKAISKAGFNVVLQNNDSATDDGSLSVLAGRRGKTYINIEAQTGHLEQQKRMLMLVNRLYAD